MRQALYLAAALALSTSAWVAKAETVADMAAAAAKKPTVTWYESSPAEQGDKVIAAFNAKYPNVKVKQIRLVGGNDLAVRVVQEMQARGYSADVITGGADHLWRLKERGYTVPVNGEAVTIAKAYMPNPNMMATAASVYVLAWNTQKVKEAEVPTTWEQVLDPKWTNRIGSWVRAAAFAQLAATQGVDTARKELERFVKLKPMLFKSTFPLAQAVGSGEIDLGIGFYHSTLPPIEAGAPVKMRALDIVPMHIIYSGITKGAKNPEGARVFLAWLASEEGALAYETATGRGNPLMPRTKTAQFIKGKKLSEWAPEKSGELGALNDLFNQILETVGSAR
jgi:iron(III) transport system substrate-binding protein